MKYELVKESKTMFEGREIYRIRSLKDFNNVTAGDIGGWVCSYNNLSQEGDCWIYDKAKCLDKARILDNAKMYDNSKMFDNSIMYDNSKMFDNSIMWNNAEMWNNARMYDNAVMLNNSIMYDNSKMFNKAKMFNNSIMCNNARMCGNATMYDSSIMYDNSKMFDNSKMYNKARIFGNAILDENKILYGSINKSYKKIFQHYHENKLITAILTKKNEILYSIGCQIGITKEKFIDRIYNDCKVKGNGLKEYPYRQEYLDIIDIAENYLRKFI